MSGYFTNVQIRKTCTIIISVPESDVEWRVTPDGKFTLSWLKKIADFKEDNEVSVVITDEDTGNSREFTGTASEVIVPSLKLGSSYKVEVKDTKVGDEIDPFEFEAYPNCTNGVRSNLTCSYLSPRSLPFRESKSACQGKSNSIPLVSDEEVKVKSERLLSEVTFPEESEAEYVWVGSNEVSASQRSNSREPRIIWSKLAVRHISFTNREIVHALLFRWHRRGRLPGLVSSQQPLPPSRLQHGSPRLLPE